MHILFFYIFAFFGVLSKAVVADRNAQTFRFANTYGNHMVLQKAPSHSIVWGFGEVGQKVHIGLLGIAYTVLVSKGPQEAGVWKVTLDAQKAGGPYIITASSVVNGTAQNIKLEDVYFGDVWVCSGQSNMQFSLTQVVNLTKAAKEADSYPEIRLFTAFQVSSDTPLYELGVVQQPWSVASSATVNGGVWKYFSAVCWFFAKNLYDKYKYPLGLIATDWGGTAVEVWSSPDALKTCNVTDQVLLHQERFLSPEEKIFVATPTKPSVLYNAMIHPLLNMTIYGAIWYQGEANINAPDTYNCTFPAMIDDWREKWYDGTYGHTDPQFPFGFVQLSSFGTDPKFIGGFPVIRWAQTANYGYVPNSRMRNVFMAVSMDLGNASSPWGSIHPNDKQDVGYRLALSGRAIAYSDPVYHTGPVMVRVSAYYSPMEGWFVDVFYTEVGQDGIDIKSRNGFEYFCESPSASTWIAAEILSSSFYKVSLFGLCPAGTGDVAGIRYAWRQDPCPFQGCAVYSKAEGLPSGPFIKYAPF